MGTRGADINGKAEASSRLGLRVRVCLVLGLKSFGLGASAGSVGDTGVESGTTFGLPGFWVPVDNSDTQTAICRPVRLHFRPSGTGRPPPPKARNLEPWHCLLFPVSLSSPSLCLSFSCLRPPSPPRRARARAHPHQEHQWGWFGGLKSTRNPKP